MGEYPGIAQLSQSPSGGKKKGADATTMARITRIRHEKRRAQTDEECALVADAMRKLDKRELTVTRSALSSTPMSITSITRGCTGASLDSSSSARS